MPTQSRQFWTEKGLIICRTLWRLLFFSIRFVIEKGGALLFFCLFFGGALLLVEYPRASVAFTTVFVFLYSTSLALKWRKLDVSDWIVDGVIVLPLCTLMISVGIQRVTLLDSCKLTVAAQVPMIEKALEKGDVEEARRLTIRNECLNAPLHFFSKFRQLAYEIELATNEAARIHFIQDLEPSRRGSFKYTTLSKYEVLNNSYKESFPRALASVAQESQRQAQESERKRALDPGLDPRQWGGLSNSVPVVEKYVLDFVNDPDSVVFENWLPPKKIEKDGTAYWHVVFRYRFKNKAGGYERLWATAHIREGKLNSFENRVPYPWELVPQCCLIV